MENKRKRGLQKRLVFSGVKHTARQLGVSREHLTQVLHGSLKANETLARRLQRMGFAIENGKVIAE